MLIDTHAHIYSEYYEDINEVINGALDDGIQYIINAGTDNSTNKEVIKLAKTYTELYAVLGIHPENVDNYEVSDIKFIEENINTEKVIGIGEIGLDYYYTKDNKERQKELFISQLKIAEKYKLPVVIHSREAIKDTMDILKEFNVKGVMHSFSGSLETAQEYIKMGYLLGINGVITFKNSNLKDIIKEIPLSNIVIETDAPYLTPHPYRGTKNEPKYVRVIAEFLCGLYSLSIEEIEEITNQNVKGLFSKIS